MQRKVAHDADQPKQPDTGLFGGLKKKVLSAEQTVLLFKNLSIVGLLGAAVGSYFQYVAWREEQNIARYKEDFAAATAAFADAAGTLSNAMNLQQLVYFNFRDAIGAGVDADDEAFQTKSGRKIYDNYVSARVSLRQGIDTLARRLEIYVDWPSNRSRDASVQTSGDPLNSHSLGNYDFDCNKYRPDYRSIDSLDKVDTIPKQNSDHSIQVDWKSTKHHIVTFQYCFEQVHKTILGAREWASKSPVSSALRDKIIRHRNSIQTSLDGLVERLDGFMILTMWRIEDIRRRYQTKNYPCHLLPVARWCG